MKSLQNSMRFLMQWMLPIFGLILLAGWLFSACTESDTVPGTFNIAAPDSSLLDYDRIVLKVKVGESEDVLFDRKLVSLEELKGLQSELIQKGKAFTFTLEGFTGSVSVYFESRKFDGTAFEASKIERRPGRGLRLELGGQFQIPLGQISEIPIKAVYLDSGTIISIRWSLDGKKTWSEKSGSWSGNEIDLKTDPIGPFSKDEDALLYIEVYASKHIKISGQKRLQFGAGGAVNKVPKISIVHSQFYGLTGDSLAMSVVAEDPDGRLVNFSWDFDADGKIDSQGDLSVTRTEVTAKHAYAEHGTFQVTVRITDNHGDESLAGMTANILTKEAALADLTITPGTLKTAFVSGKGNIEAIVPPTAETVNLTLPPKSPGAKVTVTDSKGAEVDATKPVPVRAGENLFTIKVENGQKIETYTLNIQRASADASPNNELSDLRLLNATLIGGFVNGKTSYDAEVKGDAGTVSVICAAADTAALLVLDNFKTMRSSGDTAAISLTGVTTNVVLTVTAQNGSAKEYRIAITKKKSDDAALSDLQIVGAEFSSPFSPDTLAYDINLPKAAGAIILKPFLRSSMSTLKVNDVSATSGAPINVEALAEGTSRIINISVTAESERVQTYTIRFSKDAGDDVNLAALSTSPISLSVDFKPNTILYKLDVEPVTDKLFVTATPATAGATLQAGLSGALTAMVAGKAFGISLVQGMNTIEIKVIGPSTAAKTYTIQVTKPSGDNADLKTLDIGGTALTPNFSSKDTNYTASVPHAISQITATATLSDAKASLSLNGNAISSAESSKPIALAAGKATEILFSVKAQDGKTTKNYHVMVLRAASAVNSLDSLSLSGGAIAFEKTKTSYTIPLPNSMNSVGIKAVLADLEAAMTIDGKPAKSGEMTTIESLPVLVDRKVEIIITAPNKEIKTYTLTFQRAGSGNANLNSLIFNPGSVAITLGAGDTYSTAVPYATAQGTVTITLADAGSKAYLLPDSASPLLPGVASRDVGLTEGGVTPISIRVIAQDGSRRVYLLNVSRGARPKSTNSALANLSATAPCSIASFSATTTSYSCSIGAVAAAPTLTATLVPGTTLSITGGAVAGNGTTLTIAPGSFAKADFKVTAEDGVANTTYSITVTRLSGNNSLASLTASGCAMSPAIYTAASNYYACTISSTALAPTFTATAMANTTVQVKLNGTNVAGLAAKPDPISGAFAGASFYTTAQDPGIPVRKDSVNVYRQSNLRGLTGLSVNSAAVTIASSMNFTVNSSTASVILVPNFSKGVLGYRLGSTGTFTSISSGASSTAIPLGLPNTSTLIELLATSEDPAQTTSYALTVRRQANAQGLTSLLVSGTPISPISPNMNYSVGSAVSTVTITPTASAGSLSWRVGTSGPFSSIVSNATSNAIGLNAPGLTSTIQILATAEDAAVTTTYTLTIARAALNGNTQLSSLVVNDESGSHQLSIGPTMYYTVESWVNSLSLTATPSAGTTSIAYSPSQTLTLGGHGSVTTGTITATAQSGASANYQVNITRKEGLLSNLSLSGGNFSVAFTPENKAYYISMGTNTQLYIFPSLDGVTTGQDVLLTVDNGAPKWINLNEWTLIEVSATVNTLFTLDIWRGGSATRYSFEAGD